MGTRNQIRQTSFGADLHIWRCAVEPPSPRELACRRSARGFAAGFSISRHSLSPSQQTCLVPICAQTSEPAPAVQDTPAPHQRLHAPLGLSLLLPASKSRYVLHRLSLLPASKLRHITLRYLITSPVHCSPLFAGHVRQIWTVLGEQQIDKNGTETSAGKINRTELLETCDVQQNWTALGEQRAVCKKQPQNLHWQQQTRPNSLKTAPPFSQTPSPARTNTTELLENCTSLLADTFAGKDNRTKLLENCTSLLTDTTRACSIIHNQLRHTSFVDNLRLGKLPRQPFLAHHSFVALVSVRPLSPPPQSRREKPTQVPRRFLVGPTSTPPLSRRKKAALKCRRFLVEPNSLQP